MVSSEDRFIHHIWKKSPMSVLYNQSELSKPFVLLITGKSSGWRALKRLLFFWLMKNGRMFIAAMTEIGSLLCRRDNI